MPSALLFIAQIDNVCGRVEIDKNLLNADFIRFYTYGFVCCRFRLGFPSPEMVDMDR